MLESYAAGRWYAAPDEGTPLLDAATGEEVARISSDGSRPRARWRRTPARVGGPALRALTFHERAGLLKALAKHLDRADQGRALRAVAPHRRHPARLAGRHRRRHRHRCSPSPARACASCPTTPSSLDGDARARSAAAARSSGSTSTPRGRASRCRSTPSTSRSGGCSRSSPPRSSPGCPRIVKPAGQTAYLTELVVRRIVESGLLPEGSLQLLCGSAGGLLDELAVQDSVAFTGSAHTAGLLRNHPTCSTAVSQLGVEADSLNCSILGPDVTADDPEFELFVKGVVAEMTVKAGPEVHGHPPRHRAGGDGRHRGRGDHANGWRRSPSATRARRRPDGRAGEPRPARGGAQGDPVAARLGRARVRRPGPRRPRRRRRRARRVPLPGPAPRPTAARSSRTTSSRSARSARCSRYDARRRGRRAGGARARAAWSVRGHPRPRGRAARRARLPLSRHDATEPQGRFRSRRRRRSSSTASARRRRRFA